MEILSIIRGERVPGLKENTSLPFEGGPGGAGQGGLYEGANMKKRWAQDSSAKSKRCLAAQDIVHVMASATLSQAVRQLALPVMPPRHHAEPSQTSRKGKSKGRAEEGSDQGDIAFMVIDAERGIVEAIRTEEDLARAASALVSGDKGGGGGGGSATSSSVADGTVSFWDPSGEGDGKAKRSRGALEKGEVMDAPEQLAQYYMMVSCKWRLAALLSFLRAHSHQKVGR